MNMLDRKLLRDFRRLWAQGLAIGLVAAAGVMTLLLGVGTYQSLFATRQAYYERYSFADIFAQATRAPLGLMDRIEAIPGVAVAAARISETAVLDIAGMDEPATGLILSIPDQGQATLNRLYLVKGRLPVLGHEGEIVVSEAFADAHQFGPGDGFDAIMGGVKRRLTITGIVLSPEYVYSIGSSDILPDDKRFGIVWMRYGDAAASYNLTGAFNSVSLKLNRGTGSAAVIDDLDTLLKPYGGQGAYDRSQQISDQFLSSELTQLKSMSYVLPPIFLGVAAFLLNMTLTRLITLEREQIGLLKALGYSALAIGWHYMKFALVIAFFGTVLGWAVGAWAGRGMAVLYAEFYKFPFLLFQDRPSAYALSGFAAMAAAALGSIQAVRAVARLSPAVAMRPPAPLIYRQFLLDRLGLTRLLPQGLTMALRNLSRKPLRAGLTIVGISLSTGILVSALFTYDSIDYIIDVTYFKADRQQATLSFAHPVTRSGIEAVKHLPGVMAVEPTRVVAVNLKNGLSHRRTALTGKPAKADLSRVVDNRLDPIQLPDSGIALSSMLADILKARVGDRLTVELLDGSEKELRVPVTQIVEQFMGLGAYMEISELNRILGEAPVANGAHLMVDADKTDALYHAVKGIPVAAGLSLQRKSLQKFRDTIGENMDISMGVYIGLAVIIVFGVVYNAMRIQLSERARELASLRVLGFTRTEVLAILLSELALLTLIAIPAGWMMGYGMGIAMAEGFKSELFRLPLIISRSSYVSAGLIVLAATGISAAIVGRRVAALDMVAVLKTRE